MGAHELRAARAHAAVAAGYEHVRVATIEADNALAHAPSLGRGRPRRSERRRPDGRPLNARHFGRRGRRLGGHHLRDRLLICRRCDLVGGKARLDRFFVPRRRRGGLLGRRLLGRCLGRRCLGRRRRRFLLLQLVQTLLRGSNARLGAVTLEHARRRLAGRYGRA